MKLGKSALLEIVAIVQDGLVNGRDISQALRDIDLVNPYVTGSGETLELSIDYVKSHPRSDEWEEPSAGDVESR